MPESKRWAENSQLDRIIETIGERAGLTVKNPGRMRKTRKRGKHIIPLQEAKPCGHTESGGLLRPVTSKRGEIMTRTQAFHTAAIVPAFALLVADGLDALPSRWKPAAWGLLGSWAACASS